MPDRRRSSPRPPTHPTQAVPGDVRYGSKVWAIRPSASAGNADALRAFAAAGIAAKPTCLGMESFTSSPAEFGELLRRQVAKWAQVIKSANIKFDYWSVTEVVVAPNMGMMAQKPRP